MRSRMLATLIVSLAAAGAVCAQPPQPAPLVPPPPRSGSPYVETLPNPTPLDVMPAEIMAAPPVVSGAVLPPEPGTPAGWFWRADADAVLWFVPSHRNPTFISSPTLAGTLLPGGGSNSLGDENINRHMLPGARVALGYWWMEENPWTPGRLLPMAGFETRFMFVGQRTVTQSINTAPTIVRPFFDINDATPAVLIVAAPGLANGSLTTRAAQSIWGGEANYWRNLYYEWPGTTCSIDGMVGVRYLNLDDSVQISTDTQFLPLAKIDPAFLPAFASLAGNHINDFESFAAHNRFYGGQLGARASLIFDRFIVSGQFQLGLGVTNEELTIQGAQLRTLANGTTIQSPGALLALPSNIGRHNHNEFTMVPEFGTTVTIPVNEHVAFGFTFTTLYWSRIIRAGDQLDTAINIAQIPSFPGAATAPPASSNHPAPQFNQSDLWLLGAMVTATFRW